MKIFCVQTTQGEIKVLFEKFRKYIRLITTEEK